MPKRRKFKGELINRLIVSVPLSMVEQIDQLTRCKYALRLWRS
jgi:hypothetical protein